MGVDNRPGPATGLRSIRGVIRHLPRPTRAGLLAPALILLLLVAALVSGCGGDSSAAGGGDGGADPASIAPPGSALFLSLDVNPQGTTKANVEAVGGALLDTDDFPGELQRLLSKSSKSSATGDLDFRSEERRVGKECRL